MSKLLVAAREIFNWHQCKEQNQIIKTLIKNTEEKIETERNEEIRGKHFEGKSAQQDPPNCRRCLVPSYWCQLLTKTPAANDVSCRRSGRPRAGAGDPAAAAAAHEDSPPLLPSPGRRLTAGGGEGEASPPAARERERQCGSRMFARAVMEYIKYWCGCLYCTSRSLFTIHTVIWDSGCPIRRGCINNQSHYLFSVRSSSHVTVDVYPIQLLYPMNLIIFL